MTKDDEASSLPDRPAEGTVGDDRVLIQRMLELTPEQRLLGLVQAAAFFGDARVTDSGPGAFDPAAVVRALDEHVRGSPSRAVWPSRSTRTRPPRR